MRRPFEEELERMHRIAQTQARVPEEKGTLAVTYLVAEVEHLENVLRDICETANIPFQELIRRRKLTDLGDVTLEILLRDWPYIT